MEVEKYVLVDDSGARDETTLYDDCQDAIAEAGTTHAVEALKFSLDDIELVYTPDGTQTWPPAKAQT